eukprot:gnl/MRDRNA2_/MRDRNA2_43273_c0_seq2.p1 gnl/MRDRNA2_/MRDRNA2_43273_c0~~gnl/MRDRNA2_/MRDRNA2_43273_c0_seq2.p1  ORF type:complete len:204 (-),score=35.09 gnl/MRDRNA2_/MRDRNA2_43273_c0_seq2:109-720(-)
MSKIMISLLLANMIFMSKSLLFHHMNDAPVKEMPQSLRTQSALAEPKVEMPPASKATEFVVAEPAAATESLSADPAAAVKASFVADQGAACYEAQDGQPRGKIDKVLRFQKLVVPQMYSKSKVEPMTCAERGYLLHKMAHPCFPKELYVSWSDDQKVNENVKHRQAVWDSTPLGHIFHTNVTQWVMNGCGIAGRGTTKYLPWR